MTGSSSRFHSRLWMTSEWRNRLCGITTAPNTLIIINMEFSGKVGFTQPVRAAPHSTSTNISSYRNDSPMMETNRIIQRSILLYVFVSNIPMQAAVTITAPTLIGIPNSIRSAIAPPKISASEVEMLAPIAESKMGRLT